nr:MAG TPA: hypothetical protein [Caudoviricetes sp.]
MRATAVAVALERRNAITMRNTKQSASTVP